MHKTVDTTQALFAQEKKNLHWLLTDVADGRADDCGQRQFETPPAADHGEDEYEQV